MRNHIASRQQDFVPVCASQLNGPACQALCTFAVNYLLPTMAPTALHAHDLVTSKHAPACPVDLCAGELDRLLLRDALLAQQCTQRRAL